MPDCGVSLTHSLHDSYNILEHGLQHRGQTSAGIGNNNGRVVKWDGLVENFKLSDLVRLFKDGKDGESFAGHVRYATAGNQTVQTILQEAHPVYSGGNENFHGNHVTATGASPIAVHNGTLVGKFDGLDTRRLLECYQDGGAERIMVEIPAAYAAIILDGDNAFAFRDRFGIRPLWFGEKDGRYVVASENHALREIGAKPIREVRPGEVLQISEGGRQYKSRQILPPLLRFCMFEHRYLGHPESRFNGITNWDVRYNSGLVLAEEYRPKDADIVTYPPHCPEPCALAYSEATGIPLLEIFYKIDAKRTFIQLEGRRHAILRDSLHLNDEMIPLIVGKNIVLIDDSIVRGDVSEYTVRLLLDAGARGVYVLSATPPIGGRQNGEWRSCLYGVAMPETDSFATVRYAAPTIREFRSRFASAIGAADVYYISREGHLRAIGLPPEKLCEYCIGGPKPV